VNHAETRSHMADYLEGDLDLTRRALLDAHLDSCEACSQDFKQMRTTIGLLRGLETPAPPPFLVESVMRRVREGEGRVRFADRIRDFMGTFATPQIALPATALAVGLMLATGGIDPASISLQGFGDDVRSAPPASRTRILAFERLSGTPGAPHLHVNGRPPAVGRAPRVAIALPRATSSRRAFIGSQGQTHPSAPGSASDATPTVVVRRWPAAPQNPTLLAQSPLSRTVGSRVPGGEMLPISGPALAISGPALAMETAANSSGSTGLMESATLSVRPPARNSNVPLLSPVTATTEFRSDRSDQERAMRRAAELDQRLEHMMRRPRVFSAEFASYSVAEQEIWLRNLALRARELGRGTQLLHGLQATDDRLALQLATAFAAELRQVDQAKRDEMAALSGVSVSESNER
jgi:hypothetical protein